MLTLGFLALIAATPPLVVLDAGHGGAQQGAVGVCGAREKDVTLAITQRLAALLGASGRMRVQVTRDADVDVALEDRASRANAAGAALFLSVHANASPENAEARGVETFFLSLRAQDKRTERLARRENEGRDLKKQPKAALDLVLEGLRLDAAHKGSQTLAMLVQSTLAARLGHKSRGVLQAPFLVLKDATAAAVLVEVGFLTHREECAQLASAAYQNQIALGLAGAVLAYLGSTDASLAQR